MRILISNPPWFFPIGSPKAMARRMGIRAGSRWPYTTRISRGYFPFPFNMAYADAYLKGRGIDSTLRDSILHLEEYQDFFEFSSAYDYIAMETSAASRENDCYVAKKLSKKSKIILVGMHATAFADELIKSEEIFAVLKGEYEKSLYDCVTKGEAGVYEFDEWENIDDASFPTRDETVYRYRTPRHPLAVNIWGSRGCPYKCSFCYVTCFHEKNRYRPHSPERVGREIESVLRRLPKINYIYFDDDTFNIGDKRIREISKIMKGFGLLWGAMCRVDTCNLETFKIMKENGCWEIKVGIESGSQRILDDIINKSLNLENAKKTIIELKKMGLRVHGSYMYGFPTETPEEVEMTRKVMHELRCNSNQYSHLGLLSGTPLWKEFERIHKREPSSEESDGVLLKGRK
ncbi:MAG TPA: radical SAM protein [Candidatus Aminicenantes bacterium]|nr:radical SAM protein [Candidatus Aminicenantes bacterium]